MLSQYISGSSAHVWETKLQEVNRALKDWEKTSYVSIEAKKLDIQNNIQIIHQKMEIEEVIPQLLQ